MSKNPAPDDPRACGRTHPDTGWPYLVYCTRAKNHTGPHHSALKGRSWSKDERKPRY